MGTQLPKSDNERSTYQCGSTAFDIPYYILVGLCVTSIVVVAAVVRWGAAHSCYAAAVRAIEDIIRNIEHCKGKLGRLDNLCKVAAVCTAFALLVLLPLYLTLQKYCGVMSYPYAWSASAAFLSGGKASDVLIVLWMAIPAIFLCAVDRYGICASKPDSERRLEELTSSGYSNYEGRIVFTLYTAVNVVVVGSVNVLYVYVAIYQSTSVLFVVRILMSVFKLFWNNICAEYVLYYLCEWVQPGSSVQADRLVLLQLTIALVNTVVIPCLVVAGISSDCFYNVFVAAPAVSSQYASQVCQIGNVESQCIEYLAYPGTTTFSPPFTYKYQCSSSLVTYYAPPFVYMCIVSIFVVPVALHTAVVLRTRARKGTYWYFLIDYCIPTIMNPLSAEQDQAHVRAHTSFFKGPHAVITLLTLLGLVLTFGVVFPPLAAAFTAAMVAAVLLGKYNVGKFQSAAQALGLAKYLEVIERDCLDLDIVPVHANAVWMLITLSCWFYSLFLFDTLGSAVGFHGAYWVLIVIPLMPLCFYAGQHVIRRYIVKPINNIEVIVVNKDGQDATSIELGERKPNVNNDGALEAETETHNIMHNV